MPWHFGHSRNFVLPSVSASILTWQRGQSSFVSIAGSVAGTAAPQCEQNFAPAKIVPKHEGHVTVASRAPQWSHCVASAETGAPHIGQFIVSGFAIFKVVAEKC